MLGRAPDPVYFCSTRQGREGGAGDVVRALVATSGALRGPSPAGSDGLIIINSCSISWGGINHSDYLM